MEINLLSLIFLSVVAGNLPYFRRNAISSAIGKISSYKSNYKNWEENGKKGNPPKLSYEHFEMPTFYRGNMYKTLEDKHYI